jgi:hypothetical protein
MIEKIQNQTRICNKSQLKYFVKLLSSGEKSLNDLKLACNSTDYTFSRIFDDIIILLEWLEVIRISENKIVLLIDENLIINSDNMISNLFFSNLFNKMNNQNILSKFLNSNNIKYFASENIVTINNNFILFKFSQFRNLLIDLDFLNYDTIISNQFLINNYYKPWFIKEIIPLLDNQNVSRKLSLSDLKEKQKQNNLLGIEAERFVFSFEKRRLSGHLRFSDIQIISEEWSNAGYDIQSFSNNLSIIIDRFIEVKSYEGIKPYFYWSRNEMKVARQKQNNYWIYLVNRKEMNNAGYEPIMKQNPIENILNDENWNKQIEKYRIDVKANVKSILTH